MDKRKILLLKYLSKECGESYKVMDCANILKAIKLYKNNFDGLKKDIEFLAHRNFVDLKYLDKDNVCLAIKDNSRVLQENLKIEKGFNKKLTLMFVVFSLVSGVFAFLGAMLAIILFG